MLPPRGLTQDDECTSVGAGSPWSCVRCHPLLRQKFYWGKGQGTSTWIISSLGSHGELVVLRKWSSL